MAFLKIVALGMLKIMAELQHLHCYFNYKID